MNYRHAFHAGNHADVLKHFTLARLIALLSRKEAPFAYLDSHAGVGLYDPYRHERVATYAVRVEGRRILLNPDPLPPGTPVEPARIED